MLIKFLFVFVLSFFISLLLTPVAKFLSYKFNIIDKPGNRKIHKHPIPLLGGLVVFFSFFISILFVDFSSYLLGVSFIALLFMIFGFFDDAGIKIHAKYKIIAHLLFSFLLIYFTGIAFDFFKIGILNWILTACFIAFMTNSFNMLDGMDGLVSGVSFLTSSFFAILALKSGQYELVLVSFAIIGTTLGFLRYNFNPASIFLGEAGATLLGFLLSILAIEINIYSLWDVALLLGVQRLQIIAFVVPLIVLGIPIFDTYFVFINRFLHDVKFNQPGKDHSHHRIHLMGFSQKGTVLTLYAIQIILGFIALAIVRSDLQQFFALLSVVIIFVVGFTVFLSRVKVYSQE